MEQPCLVIVPMSNKKAVPDPTKVHSLIQNQEGAQQKTHCAGLLQHTCAGLKCFAEKDAVLRSCGLHTPDAVRSDGRSLFQKVTAESCQGIERLQRMLNDGEAFKQRGSYIKGQNHCLTRTTDRRDLRFPHETKPSLQPFVYSSHCSQTTQSGSRAAVSLAVDCSHKNLLRWLSQLI